MKILVAEDESDIALMYKDMLEQRNHNVTLTRDGSECIQAYHAAIEELEHTSEEYLSKNPPFDAVILDYAMPNMNGLQAAKLILVANKHQRIIFASAYAKSTIEQSVLELHAVVEILQKPFDVEVLINLIENKSVHEELKKINASLSKQEQIQVGQLWEMLHGLKKLKVDTPLLS